MIKNLLFSSCLPLTPRLASDADASLLLLSGKRKGHWRTYSQEGKYKHKYKYKYKRKYKYKYAGTNSP